MMKARMEWTGKFLRYLMNRFATDNLANIAATLEKGIYTADIAVGKSDSVGTAGMGDAVVEEL